MGDELRSQSWIFDMFILDRIDRELHSLKRLELKFGLSSDFSEFFDKIPVKILLDVLFRVFRFSRASFNALTSSFIVLKLRRHLCTETYEGFHGNFIFSHVKLPCEIRHLWYYNSQLSFFESITKLQNPRQIRWTKYPKSRFNMTYCLSTKLFNPWQLRE